jgi:hypothetical protein
VNDTLISFNVLILVAAKELLSSLNRLSGHAVTYNNKNKMSGKNGNGTKNESVDTNAKYRGIVKAPEL